MDWMRACPQDVRYAVRNLMRSPGFTAVAALTLAIGIGANTTIFSIIDTILLRPLPYRDPGQLVRLYETEAAPGHYPFAPPDFLDWKAQNKTFQDMALYGWSGDMNLSGGGRPDHVLAVPTEANFFSLLGVQPLLGRTWAAGEDQPGKDQVAILSYGLWREHFAGDPGVVGRSISLNSKKYTIVGVMPASFRFPFETQMWIPLDMDSKSLGERGSHWANAIGRLKAGVSLDRARADLKVIATRLEKTYPDSNDKVGSGAVALHDDLVGDSRGSLIMMLSAVGLVLLIACANVANLLLSRAVSRQKEMAVRSALGAARGRLLRQLLTESLLLSAVGGALGLLVAWLSVDLVSHGRGFTLPRFNIIQLNGEVLAFTFALALATGILFGMAPALRTSRPDLHEELKGGAGSSVSPGKRRRFTSNVLVVGEMALSLLLLVSAGLLLKDFARLRGLNIGVRPDGVFTAAVRLPEEQYKKAPQQLQFALSLLDKSARLPGVDAAAISDRLPLEGGSNYYVKLRGQTSRKSNLLVERHNVSPGYFRAMGIRLLEGRVFAPADIERTTALNAHYDRLSEGTDQARRLAEHRQLPEEEANAMVYPVVINEGMARAFWPDKSPLGEMFSQGSDHGPWRQVIGVVNDVRQWGLAHKPVPEAYDAFTGNSSVFLVLHTNRQPSSLTADVRRALGQLDAGLPLFSVRSMYELIAEHAQGEQFLSLLVGSFAALAVLLAAIGIYGVLSFVVTERTREIGIRMSLGASRRQVLGQVILEGMRLAAVGFAAGLVGALAAGRVLESLLHEVKAGDPAVFAFAAGFLTLVALVACYVPARRAARLDPMRALRYE
ncbi:MAG TPA: ABC transporter permease [Bryobacteraceae bacterium]|nr:ABC transporter permease [Bryobacteraceae bacterium]